MGVLGGGQKVHAEKFMSHNLCAFSVFPNILEIRLWET